jgi:hypothetical protein
MLVAVCTIKAQSTGTSEQSPRQPTDQSTPVSSSEMAEAEQLNKNFLSLFAQGNMMKAYRLRSE